jgi:uncharacterized protein YicC (UPF0701 family)
MVDLSVLNTFNPVSLSDTKNSGGDGITFESELNPLLKSDSQDADKLAKIIQKEAEKLKSDKAKQLELIERSIAYVRAKGGSDLSSDVYEQLKNKDSSEFIDVFGKADKVPDAVEKSESAKTAWGQIMTGAAYDHIEKNKNSIAEDLKSALSEADDKKILKVADNPALVNLKEQLMESGMSSTEADKDISKMLRETRDSDGKPLLEEGKSVQIEMDSSSNALSSDRTKKLESLRDELTTRINKAKTPEEAQRILKESVPAFEKLIPDSIKPETFYTEQMQGVLDKSKEYKDYRVAANPSLEKITVDGKELITTNQDKVYVNPDGKFVNSRGREYKVTDDDKIKGKEIAIKDIEPSKPEISIFMDKDQNKVEDENLTSLKQYCKDQKLVYEASGNEKALRELNKVEGVLDKTEVALNERRKKEGKNDNNNTLSLIVGIVSALATIVAALSQGGGRTTTVTGSGYNGQNGQNGQNGLYPVSDKYGYNRGYQATVDAAYERSNQYLSTFYNNPVKTRATIMMRRGMAAINGEDGGPGVYGYIRPTRSGLSF